MGIVDQAVAITFTITSGSTVTYQDNLYDYRYYRLITGGSSDDTVNFVLNGATMNIPGGTWIDGGVFSLQVLDAGEVVIQGVKSTRKLFGDNVHPYNIEFPPYNV
jgi:hypothetical protein